MTTRKLIKEALQSGLEPIIVYKRNVYNCNGNPEPIAYRTETVLNSTVLGRLTPAQFQVTADKSERGILLSDKTLSYVAEAIEAKCAAEERFDWISVYCPITMLTKTDVIAKLSEMFGGDKKKRGKLCLEFPAHALYEEPETLRTALLDLKVLGVKSALVGYGGEFCPMMRLASFPFDYVILDHAVNALMFREGGAKAAETLISYARQLRIEVIAVDLESEEQQTAFYRADCYGCTMNEEPERLLPYIDFTPDASAFDDAETGGEERQTSDVRAAVGEVPDEEAAPDQIPEEEPSEDEIPEEGPASDEEAAPEEIPEEEPAADAVPEEEPAPRENPEKGSAPQESPGDGSAPQGGTDE